MTYDTSTAQILELIKSAQDKLPRVTSTDPETGAVQIEGFLTSIDQNLRQKILESIPHTEVFRVKSLFDDLDENIKAYKFYEKIGSEENQKALAAVTYASSRSDLLAQLVEELIEINHIISRMNSNWRSEISNDRDAAYREFLLQSNKIYPDVIRIWKKIGMVIQLSLDRDEVDDPLIEGILTQYVPIWIRDRYV